MNYNSLTSDWIRKAIISFKNDNNFILLDQLYKTKSYAEILGVERREISHSNFLAWILDYQGDHQLGDYPLKKFLDILVVASNDALTNQHQDLFDLLVTENYELTAYTVGREIVLGNKSRPDLVIEVAIRKDGQDKNIKIVIENKVGAKENNDQTLKYHEHFQNEYQGATDTSVLYVFLCAMPGIKFRTAVANNQQFCKCEHFIPINYQLLVTDLYERLEIIASSERVKVIINEYLMALSQPALGTNIENRGKIPIMALGTNERKLLNDFWEKNKELILASLYALTENEDTSEETRKTVEKAIESISNSSRNRDRYNLYYNEELFRSGFRKADIGLNVVLLLDEKGLIDTDVFNFLENDMSASFKLLKTPEEFTENEIQYNKYKTDSDPELIYDNIGYYVARNWNVDNAIKFRKKIEAKFPAIKILVEG